ncbi:MAG: acetyl-CoA C-acetyltransferase [Deltaproteobacteria bacterium]|nr:acetyl-CoA C-acetyltransferase [Deltaproteobacteria bacterium]
MTQTGNDVVIVSGVRTPIGKFGGALKELRAHRLASLVMTEALARAGVAGEDLDEVIAGDCIQCPDEANTARTAALVAGIPVEVPAYTIQKQCSSSMQALASARAQILAGDAEIVLVVGTESMSNAPYVLNTARWGQRLMHGEMTDAVWELLHSGSGLLGKRMIMGETAENLAEKYGISRQEQDEVAVRSHNNAEAATATGRFKEEIVPVVLKGKKGETIVDTDEHIRFGVTLADLVGLKPAFRKDGGTVTAGNASGLNDGAAAAVVMSRRRAKELGLKPLARVVAQASAGVAPELMGYGPVPAVQKLLAKTGLALGDVGVIELNEAFAAQYLACEKGLGLDRARVNVNGSGIGLGHPVGCTGLRITLSLLYEMRRRGTPHGIATLCVGGGMGMATLLELEG